MPQIEFKERVKNVIINESLNYKKYYADYQYLICSDAFVIKKYYIIDAKLYNYPHLTGVNLLLSPKEFFNKCYNGTFKKRILILINRDKAKGL